MFFLGTFPSIPVVAIMLYYAEHDDGTLSFALGVCVIMTVAGYAFVHISYPTSNEAYHKEYLSPCCQYLFSSFSFRRHLQNDFLILCWIFFAFSNFGNIVCIGLLTQSIILKDGRLIYDYATGLASTITLTISSMYYVSGSYEYEEEKQNNYSVPVAQLDDSDIAE